MSSGGRNVRDLTGQKFGFLTVVRRASSPNRNAAWECVCSCGETRIVIGMRLVQNRVKSCNRNGHRYNSDRPAFYRQHLPEYRVWRGIHKRCKAKTGKHGRRYGGRGIRVCEAWDSFAQFFADMGPRPTLAHTIERKDNDGHYEPSNCVWATNAEQQRNRGNTVFIEYQGERIRLADLTDRLGLNRGIIYGRLKNGWSIEDAVTIPINSHKKKRLPKTPVREPPDNLAPNQFADWTPESLPPVRKLFDD